MLDDWITMPTGYYYCGIGWSGVTWGTALIAVDNNSHYCYVQWWGAYNIHLRGQLWNSNYSYRYDGEGDWNSSYQGLTIRARRRGHTCSIYVSGTPTSTIATGSAYVNIATNLPEIYRPSLAYVNYIFFSGQIGGQLNVSTTGDVRIGYTRRLYDNATVDVSSAIYARVTYEVQ